jgi:hypothetical protein
MRLKITTGISTGVPFMHIYEEFLELLPKALSYCLLHVTVSFECAAFESFL